MSSILTNNAAWALQRAVYAALRNDGALGSLIGDPPRVYDRAPPDAPSPYVVLGEGRLRPLAGVVGGAVHEIRLQTVSTYGGRREVKAILAALHDALHDRELDLQTHRLVSLRFVFSDVFQRENADIYRGVARFRAVTEPVVNP